MSLSQWVFKKQGVLRYSGVMHHKQGSSDPPVAYTVADDVVGGFLRFAVSFWI